MKINKRYIWLFIILFLVELCIALFVHDRIIRPFVGDVLVVVLIYFFLKIFWNAPNWKVALVVLIFAFSVEILQYFNIVELLGLEGNPILATIIGRTFDPKDLLAYSIGFLLIVFFDKKNL